MTRAETAVCVDLADIRAAQTCLKEKGLAIRTPLIKLPAKWDFLEGLEVYLKLETLQPTASFKVRGACNAISCLSSEQLAGGVCTASAGNFAQGLAWSARELGVPCHVLIPDHTPDMKRKAMKSFGAVLHPVPFDTWWTAIETRKYPADIPGHFIHPASESSVIAGNGTIGLEILEDLPDVSAVITPYGGGGLSCGVATAIRELRPSARCYAVEVDTAAPLLASFDLGRATSCEYRPSFVDGMGGMCVLAEMFDLARRVLDDSIVVSLREIADAIVLLVEKCKVVAEGAGAAPVAAALTGKAGRGSVACVVSGGNIDTEKLVKILQGEVPT
eukprot:m.123451 g.123451  ORF g.123451 m.123451 type:complete len:331 (+) comp37822_c2_seq21:17-1009(+)